MHGITNYRLIMSYIKGAAWTVYMIFFHPCMCTDEIIIIIIISYFNWVAISLRLLLRPPVSHTLTHTHNQIKSNSNCLVAAVGHLLSCPRLVARLLYIYIYIHIYIFFPKHAS